MDFDLPPLPYSEDALTPALSARSIEHHHDRIHRSCLEKLREALRGRPEAEQPLERIVLGTSGHEFNLAAQAFDHAFFWQSMSPGGGGPPPAGTVADRIDRDLGGWSAFRTEWIRAGVERFGSGYLWLTLEDGRLDILPTPNAETPLATGAAPLVVVDLWEHAYYLDYHERRERYLEVFCDELVSWDFVARNLAAALEAGG